jgi:hypothetical protein
MRPLRNVRTGGYLGKELKFVDQFHQGTVPKTIAASLYNPTANNNLAAIAVGSGQSARIGRHVHVKSIYIQGHINIPIATAHNASAYYVSMWLVEDKQTNGAAMTPGNFLISPDPKCDADAMQNLEYSDRFSLLKKKTIRVNKYQPGTCGLDVPFRIYKKLDQKVQYTADTAAIDSIATSSFHLLVIAGEETTSNMECQYNVRVRYIG